MAVLKKAWHRDVEAMTSELLLIEMTGDQALAVKRVMQTRVRMNDRAHKGNTAPMIGALEAINAAIDRAARKQTPAPQGKAGSTTERWGADS